jgi:REP element-mobilizing transposase RayT
MESLIKTKDSNFFGRYAIPKSPKTLIFKTKMPAIKTITPLLGGSYYHIFNRGINGQEIFFQERNYIYFLQLIDKYLSEYISVLAYCLLPNHFHLVIKLNETIKIPSVERDGISELQEIKDESEIGKFISNQFRRMFITYTMAINKQENRTGSLFDKNFKRLEITENEYLLYAIFYTHFNPEKHGFSNNFTQYNFSSYQTIISQKPTKTDRNLVLDIFAGKEDFIDYHSGWHDEKESLILE